MKQLNQDPNEWDSGVRHIKSCDLAEDADFSIQLSQEVHAKVIALSNKLEHLEWAGYLLGSQKDNLFKINQIIVPKQTVTAATFTITHPLGGPDVLGTLHSHHTMGAFHSGTDIKSCGSNYPIVVVFSLPSSYVGKVKHTLPCGGFIFIDAPVSIAFPATDTTKFVAEALTHITLPVQNNYDAGIFNIGQGGVIYCMCCHATVSWVEAQWDKQTQGFVCPDCAFSNLNLPAPPFDTP